MITEHEEAAFDYFQANSLRHIGLLRCIHHTVGNCLKTRYAHGKCYVRQTSISTTKHPLSVQNPQLGIP